MEVVDKGRNFDIRVFFLVFSYCFNLVSLIEQDVHHLIELVDQFGFPSMPKRYIIEI